MRSPPSRYLRPEKRNIQSLFRIKYILVKLAKNDSHETLKAHTPQMTPGIKVAEMNQF